MKPQPIILTSWRIVVALLMILPAFGNALFFRVPGRFWILSSAVWLALFLLLYLVYLPVRYHNLSFSVTEEKVLVYSGVFYVRLRSIPLQNVQFTTLNRNPFDRIFGICSLTIIAAGGRVSLPGLRLADAQSLSSALLEPKA